MRTDLRYGPLGVQTGSILLNSSQTILDLCWDKQWDRILILAYNAAQFLLQVSTTNGQDIISHYLPEGLMVGSRIFRYRSSICFLTGRQAPTEERFLLMLDRFDGTFMRQQITLNADFDNQIAHKVAVGRRNALLAINPGHLPPETIDYNVNLTGSISDSLVALRNFPVIVGHPTLPDIRFDSELKTAAIGGEQMTIAWFRNNHWQKADLKSVIAKLNSRSISSLNAFSAFANEKSVVFGVRSNHLLDSSCLTVVVEINKGLPRVHQAVKSVFAPPVLQV